MRRRNLLEEGCSYKVASILAAIYNVFRSSNTAPFEAKDFLAKKEQSAGPQTAEQMLEMVKRLNASMGGQAPEG